MAYPADRSSSLVQYLDHLMEELVDLAPKALAKGDTDAIHDARVITRRIKAALDLLKPVLSKRYRKPLAKALRKLRRRLCPLRDLDVMTGHLEPLLPDPVVQWLMDELTNQRKDRFERIVAGTDVSRLLAQLGSWWGLRGEIAEAYEAIDHCLFETLQDQFGNLTRQAEVLFQPEPAPADLDALGGQSADSFRITPHHLRIAAKRLRYTFELADVQGHAVADSAIQSFKQMQDALGLWHDYVVLADTVTRVSLDRGVSYECLATQRQILALAQSMLGRAEEQWDQFRLLWSSNHDLLSVSVLSAIPLPLPKSDDPLNPI